MNEKMDEQIYELFFQNIRFWLTTSLEALETHKAHENDRFNTLKSMFSSCSLIFANVFFDIESIKFTIHDDFWFDDTDATVSLNFINTECALMTCTACTNEPWEKRRFKPAIYRYRCHHMIFILLFVLKLPKLASNFFIHTNSYNPEFAGNGFLKTDNELNLQKAFELLLLANSHMMNKKPIEVPLKNYSSSLHKISNCGICFENCSIGWTCERNKHPDKFHYHCIAQWFLTNRICPLCRKKYHVSYWLKIKCLSLKDQDIKVYDENFVLGYA